MYNSEFRKIVEKLEDMSKKNKLYHFTSSSNLFRILDSGKILPQYYETNTGSKNEIAVTRSKHPIKSISNTDIRITIYKDRIRTLRGLSILPINEAHIEQRKDYEDSIRKLFRANKFLASKYADLLYLFKDELLSEKDTKKVLDFITEMCMVYPSDLDKKYLEEMLINMQEYSLIRNKYYGNQLEERLRIKDGIPVKDSYIKIDILSVGELTIPNEFTPEECKNLILKNKNLFNINKNYFDFCNSISIETDKEIKKDLSKFKDPDYIKNKYSSMFN